MKSKIQGSTIKQLKYETTSKTLQLYKANITLFLGEGISMLSYEWQEIVYKVLNTGV